MNLDQVKQIKQLLLENELTQAEIGKMFGVSRGPISEIATNKKYREVEPVLQALKIAGGQPKHLNLEQQNIALFGQLENTRQERNLLKRQLKAASKRIAVVDGIVEQLAPIIQPLKPAPPVRPRAVKGKVIEETLVLMFSDNHADQVVTHHGFGRLHFWRDSRSCQSKLLRRSVY
jgi:transcriptional regulator with XRE-family HTH domain